MTTDPARATFVPPEERETAVVVVIDEPALARVYAASFPAYHALGIPLHVTLLYPWVAPGELPTALPRLAEILARHDPFTCTFAALGTFPRTVWLAPEPPTPFADLTRAIESAFPETPHYGGAFEDVVPHATLVDPVEEAELDETVRRLETTLGPVLPVTVPVAQAVVLAEQADGTMAVVARLPLGEGSAS